MQQRRDSKSNQCALMFQVRGLILFKTGERKDDTGTAGSLTANLHFYCVMNHYFDDAVCNDYISVREAEHVRRPLSVWEMSSQ